MSVCLPAIYLSGNLFTCSVSLSVAGAAAVAFADSLEAFLEASLLLAGEAPCPESTGFKACLIAVSQDLASSFFVAPSPVYKNR